MRWVPAIPGPIFYNEVSQGQNTNNAVFILLKSGKILVCGIGWGLGNADDSTLTNETKLTPVNHSAGYDGTNAKEIFYGPDMIIVLLTTGKLR